MILEWFPSGIMKAVYVVRIPGQVHTAFKVVTNPISVETETIAATIGVRRHRDSN